MTVATAVSKTADALREATDRGDRQAEAMKQLGQQIATWIETQRDYVPLPLVMKLIVWICGIITGMLAGLFGIKAAFGL